MKRIYLGYLTSGIRRCIGRIKEYFNKRKDMGDNKLTVLMNKLQKGIKITANDLKDFSNEELERFIKASTNEKKIKNKRDLARSKRKKKQKGLRKNK